MGTVLFSGFMPSILREDEVKLSQFISHNTSKVPHPLVWTTAAIAVDDTSVESDKRPGLDEDLFTMIYPNTV